MGILGAAKPVVVICTRDRGRATAFYRDTLGLAFAHEDDFAAVFNVGGVTLRHTREGAGGWAGRTSACQSHFDKGHIRIFLCVPG